MFDFIGKIDGKKIGIFATGVLFGTAGVQRNVIRTVRRLCCVLRTV